MLPPERNIPPPMGWLFSMLGCFLVHGEDASRFWPQWRGPMGNGVALHADPPVQWSEDHHVAWKVELPGKGHATPIVWDEHVYISAAIPVGPKKDPVYNQAEGAHDNLSVSRDHLFSLLAYRRSDGMPAWRRDLNRVFPHEGGHETGSLASASPVTDGERIIVSFGSHGLYCLDMQGEVLWSRDFGSMQTRHAHGEGASPALYGNRLVINWDHEGQSFVCCLDAASGKELWKSARDESTSWATPLIIEHAEATQVIVSATDKIRSYHLMTGEVLWECGGLSRNVVASPVAGHGIVVAANSYDWQAMLAIRLDGAKGDLTGSKQIAWSMNRLTPYVPSPLLYGRKLYFLRHLQGILSCVDLITGEPVAGPFRLPRMRVLFASPVGASNRIYITSREGITLVMEHSDQPKILAVNQLDDVFSASPALVDGQLFLRGESFLYCLEDRSKTAQGESAH